MLPFAPTSGRIGARHLRGGAGVADLRGVEPRDGGRAVDRDIRGARGLPALQVRDAGAEVRLLDREQAGILGAQHLRAALEVALGRDGVRGRVHLDDLRRRGDLAGTEALGQLRAHLPGRAVERLLAAEDEVKIAELLCRARDDVARGEGIGVGKRAVGQQHGAGPRPRRGTRAAPPWPCPAPS